MPVTSLRKTSVRPPEVAKLRAAPGLTQLSLAGYGARLLIGNGNGNGNGDGPTRSRQCVCQIPLLRSQSLRACPRLGVS
ncbi:hypothetical protein C3F42_01925 [Pseudomonas sp. PONIH3]|nr:hypothetical protein C3F42_01925 [Pseudomonas sp. PONIH3]